MEYNHDLATERHAKLIEALLDVKRAVEATHARLDEQNGRIRKTEMAIAVLEERSPGKMGGAWGAVGGFVSGFLAGWIKPS